MTFYIDCNLWRQSKERKKISGNCTGVHFAASMQAAEAFSHMQTFKDCAKYISALSSVTIHTQTVVLCEEKKPKNDIATNLTAAKQQKDRWNALNFPTSAALNAKVGTMFYSGQLSLTGDATFKCPVKRPIMNQNHPVHSHTAQNIFFFLFLQISFFL